VATASTSTGNPTTGAGVGRLIVVPSPSWPVLLLPQQATVPARDTAHVWGAVSMAKDVLRIPVSIIETSARPDTGTGVGRSTVVPSPSWPPRFAPQHTAPRAAVTAQV
jgi:hypothetical protein